MSNSDPPFELSEPRFLSMLVHHEPALRAYARSLVPDWDLVDEAMQEASVTLWQKRDQLRSEDGFLPWAKVVLRFKCLRQSEKLRTRGPLLSDEMLETLAQRGMDRSVVNTADRALALETCLQRFSIEHQELLLAPHRSTASVVDLAERSGKTPNSLYKLLARLRVRLTECVRLRIAAEGEPT